jgi:P27 family predicted phage terminase small subunit
MSRQRTPTAIKVLQGNPGKRKSDLTSGINLPPSMPEPPPHLSKEAKAIFLETAQLLFDLGTMSKCDVAGLELYSCNMVIFRTAHGDIASNGYFLTSPTGRFYANPAVKVVRDYQALIMKFLGESGLTAAARSRINIPAKTDPKADSIYQKYLA